MAPNTKNWDVRLADVYNAVLSCDDQFQSESLIVTDLRQAIGAMPAATQKQLSNTLHLQNQNTADWRKWVRCIGLIEAVLVAPRARRSFAQIKSQYNQTSAPQVRSAMRGMIKALDPWQDYGKADMTPLRPLKMGASISGGGASGPGSIACFVRDRATGRAMLLTNQHVVLQEHGAATDVVNAAPVILQPARMNGGSAPASVIGTYARGFLDHRMDAAVCWLNDGIPYANETRPGPNSAGVPVVGVNRTLPNVGDLVWKCGAMSCVSRGRVRDPNKPHSTV